MEFHCKRFFDAHVHCRQDEMMTQIVSYSARTCDYVVCMPNTLPMLDNYGRINHYKAELYKINPSCTYLIAAGLNSKTTHDTVVNILNNCSSVASFKLYPAGVTTNSENGVPLDWLYPTPSKQMLSILSILQEKGIILSVHGELPGREVLRREIDFIEVIDKIRIDFPALKIIFEHVSTREVVNYIKNGNAKYLAGTITLHHLHLTLDDVIGDKINVHSFCKPVAKQAADRKAICEAVLEGNRRFFLGSDSAPHLRGNKETSCGCAGIFSAPNLAEGLFEFFNQNRALALMENFTRNFGTAFYGIKDNNDGRRLVFRPQAVKVPDEVCGVVPYRAGHTYEWSLA